LSALEHRQARLEALELSREPSQLFVGASTLFISVGWRLMWSAVKGPRAAK
jgi:hypothetical protein